MERLTDFIRLSRSWSNVIDESDLFAAVGHALKTVFNVDAGCIVYRLREINPSPPRVYGTWGTFSGADAEIISELKADKWFREETLPLTERWIGATQSPSSWAKLCDKYGVRQLGVWPLVIRDEYVGALVLGRTSGLDQDDAEIMTLCALQTSLVLEMLVSRRIAEEVGRRDGLTGLLNRRGLLDSLPDFMARSEGDNILLGILDLNDFKSVNDTEGHLAGDQVLIEVANILSRHIREHGLCSRWGGDEFVFMWNYGGVEDPEQEIRSWFADTAFGASVGCMRVDRQHFNFEELLHGADRRLYLDKARCFRHSKAIMIFD